MAQRIKFKITDMDALKNAFPEVVTEEKVVRDVVDREKLYKIIKTYHSIGRTVDGVEMELNAEPELPLDEAEDNDGINSEEDYDQAKYESQAG